MKGPPAARRPHDGPRTLPGLVVAGAFLLTFAKIGFAQPSPSPQLPGDLASALAAPASLSPAQWRTRARQASDDTRRVIGWALAGQQAEAEGFAARSRTAQDYLRMLTQQPGVPPTLLRDAEHVLAMPPERRQHRQRVFQRTQSALGTLLRTDEAVLATELTPLVDQVDAAVLELTAWAAAEEDRDLHRFAVAIRPLVDRFRTDHPTADGQRRYRDHLLDIIHTWTASGLAADQRVFLARQNLCRSALIEGRVSEAGRFLTEARRDLDPLDLPAPLSAAFLSLELEYFRARGLIDAAQDAAQSLAQLLPEIRALAEANAAMPDAERRSQQAQVGQYAVQVAFWLARAGYHEDARATAAEAQAADGVEDEDRARLALIEAQACEAMEDPTGCSNAARLAINWTRSAPLRRQGYVHDGAGLALRGRLLEARRALDQAASEPIQTLPPAEQAGLLAREFLVRALVAHLLGEWDTAVDAARRSLDHGTASGETSDQMRALWFLTTLELEAGEEATALELAWRAHALASSANTDASWQRCVANTTLGEVLLSIGRPGEAAARLREGLAESGKWATARPALRGEARRLLCEAEWRSLGASPVDRSAVTPILAELDGAISDLRRGVSARGAARTVLEALRAHELAHEILLSVDARADAARVVASAEALAADQTRPPEEAGGLPWQEVDACLASLRGRAAEAAEDPDLALQAYENACRWEAQVRHRLRWRAPDGLAARFEDLDDRMAHLHLEAAIRHKSPARARQALLFLEQRRARSLRTLLASAEARWISRLGPREDPPFAPPPRFDNEALREVLREGRTVLSYVLGSRGSYVVALNGQDARVIRLPADRQTIERHVEGLLRNLRGSPDAYRTAATIEFSHILWGFLIAPVVDMLSETRELIIVPDGALDKLPFAALVEAPTSESGSTELTELRWLARRAPLRAIAATPSLGTLAMIERRVTEGPAGTPLLFGAPVVAAGQGVPAPEADSELQILAGLLPDARKLTGSRATKAHLEAALQVPCSLLHVAAHGVGTPTPGIVLSPPQEGRPADTLTTTDIASLHLRGTSLVVLAACNSALGERRGYEGALGLPRAFLVAGAQAVVAAVQEVEGPMTRAFMTAVHRELRRGARPATALLNAQRALLLRRETAWPGYWCVWTLIGAP